MIINGESRLKGEQTMTELKKGDKVILKGFTGIKLGVFEVTSATKKTVSITKKNGDELIFDRKTGRQTNVEEGKERFANSIIADDGSFVAPSTRGASKRNHKKSADEPERKPETDEDEEEEEPAPKKTKKQPAKKKPEPEPDPEDDDDDFEEVDD